MTGVQTCALPIYIALREEYEAIPVRDYKISAGTDLSEVLQQLVEEARGGPAADEDEDEYEFEVVAEDAAQSAEPADEK